MSKKLIVILGPTASGKSELAVKLAKKFKGEIVSADSRQVYNGLDIGTGKVPRDKIFNFQFSIFKQYQNSKFKIQNSKLQLKNKNYFYKRIRHYLLDVVSPKRHFTVTQYRKLALKAIDKILKNNKLPILCGGTGFYIQAVVDGIVIPEVSPDWKLRKKLEKKSNKELFQILKKLDSRRAKIIDRGNPRRLIRAIEIIIKTKKPIPAFKKSPLPYPVLTLGIKKEKNELSSLIKKRFLKWLKQGLIKEVRDLRKIGLSWKRIEDFGIHYRAASRYLQNKLSRQEMVENSIREIQNYGKRQITWFKRDKRIHWIKNYRVAEKVVRSFISER